MLRHPLRWAKAVVHHIFYPDKILAPILDVFSENPIRWGSRILLVSILGGGLLFTLIEHKGTYGDGVWWAFISAMTVGYGDYSPTTWLMRGITFGVVFGGALFLIGLGSAVNARATVRRLGQAGETPELNDDLDVIIAVIREQLDALQVVQDTLEEREASTEGVRSDP